MNTIDLAIEVAILMLGAVHGCCLTHTHLLGYRYCERGAGPPYKTGRNCGRGLKYFGADFLALIFMEAASPSLFHNQAHPVLTFENSTKVV
jgi:hypothetical protein